MSTAWPENRFFKNLKTTFLSGKKLVSKKRSTLRCIGTQASSIACSCCPQVIFGVSSSCPEIIFCISSSCPEIIRLSINQSKATSPLSHLKAKANKTRLRRKHYFVLKRTICSLVLLLVGDHRLSEQIQQICQGVFQLLCLSVFLCFFYISVFAFETRRPVWVRVDWKAR